MPVFPERQLADYAVPVAPAALMIGETYFHVTFIDTAMTVPEMRPLVFLGADLPVDGKGKYAFQDASSHEAGISPDEVSSNDLVQVELYEGSGLGAIYTFNASLDVLLRCALKRDALT